MHCPRCAQEQPDGQEECGACGVIFSRYRLAPARPRPEPPPVDDNSIMAMVWRRMFEVSPAEDGLTWLRALFLAGLLVWWLRLLFTPLTGEALLNSFLHWIHIPFHEAGHFVFQFFGSFLHILGGTLGQLLVPLAVIIGFLRQDNPYGAAIGSWWLGASFMDCAPYINDARDRLLPLLSGVTGQEDWEGHDWYQLLSRLGWLRYDHFLARLSWGLGALLMAAALAWAAWVVWRQWGRADRGQRGPMLI
jgi:hypothetical protein